MKSPPPVAAQAPPFADVGGALRRVGEIVGLALLPIAVLGTMFVVGYTGGPFAGDFHHELYPEAEMLLRGESPYPPPEQEIAGTNFVWPPASAYLVSPLTLVPPGVADVLIVLIGLACFGLALRVIGVRDWRVYGAFALWPEVVAEMRVSHLTPVIALFLACAWRWRDARMTPGLLVGLSVAVKFFVWPVGVWLASTRRFGATLVAAAVAAASLLLVLPFTGLDEYIRLLLKLGRTFDQDSYTIFGLLVQAGASDGLARGATLVAGVGLLAATWRYRSFALAVAAALVLSPIVWLDYFALAALPLALARPRLSWIWFVPLLTWGLEGAGLTIGDVSDITRLLVVFVVVFGVAFRGEPERRRAGPHAA